MLRVVFTHDDEAKKWECKVEEAKDVIEARQAFSAVVLTCHMLESVLLRQTIVEPNQNDGYDITPVVR